jgi:hypothetical protein
MSFDMNNFDPKNNQKEGLVLDRLKPWVVLKLNDQSQWITHGPFASHEVKTQLKKGEIKATDYCWTSSWADWKRIYLEPEFYLSRKPPIEFAKNKNNPKLSAMSEQSQEETFFAQDQDSNQESRKSAWREWAEKISPQQYKGWKYKKTLKENYPNPNLNRETTTSSLDGVISMLEPWDSKTKSLDFLEDSDSLKNAKETPEAARAGNYPEDKTEVSVSTGPRRFLSRAVKLALWSGILCIFAWISYRIYHIVENQETINYSMSYFVIEDYSSELPEYLYARTDLKKNEQIKIRVFDLSNKQVRTRNQKAGLMISSKGTGRIRLPMYAYNLAPGAYKLSVEIEDQKIEKEFNILDKVKSDDSTSI